MYVRSFKKLSVIWKFNFYKVLEKIRKNINQSHHNKSGVEGIVVLFNFQLLQSKNKLLETKKKPKYEKNLSKITCDLKCLLILRRVSK